MRSVLLLIIAVVLSIAGTLFVLKQQEAGSGPTAGKEESAYERVLRTGTIRCGYGVSAPYLSMDPNTKKMSGFSVDMMDVIARNLNLKVEWAEETGWGGLTTALNDGRIDLGCSLLWVSAPVAREVLFSKIPLYNAMFFWVREDDDRFATLDDLRDKKARMGFVEGDNTQEALTKRFFPDNTLVAYSKDMDSGLFFLEVSSNKVDAVLNDAPSVEAYNAKADIKLRAVSPDRPAVTVGNAFTIAKNEVMLKNMIDTAIEEILANGELAQIMKPYQEASPGAFYLPPIPYNLERP